METRQELEGALETLLSEVLQEVLSRKDSKLDGELEDALEYLSQAQEILEQLNQDRYADEDEGDEGKQLNFLKDFEYDDDY